MAAAHGSPPVPVTATGTTQCNLNGNLQVTDLGALGFMANMTPGHHAPACSNTGGSKLRTGHLRNAVSSDSWTDLCPLVSGGAVSDLTGGTISWAPAKKVAASTGVSLTGGSVSVVTATNGDQYLQLAYSGSVDAGSFAGGVSLTATSTADVAKLTADCAAGPVTGIHLKGSVTLGQ
ncbi:MAG: hypothetical protein ACREOE_09900 [Gemmatimonadales bacterium]